MILLSRVACIKELLNVLIAPIQTHTGLYSLFVRIMAHLPIICYEKISKSLQHVESTWLH